MKFAILFEDNAEFADKRTAHMPEHQAFLARNAAKIQAAGPLFAAGAGAGGLWIVEAANAEEARGLTEEDPFFPTGLRKKITVLEWRQVFADGAPRA